MVVLHALEKAQKQKPAKNAVLKTVNGDHGTTGANVNMPTASVESGKLQEQERWKWRQAVEEENVLERMKMLKDVKPVVLETVNGNTGQIGETAVLNKAPVELELLKEQKE